MEVHDAVVTVRVPGCVRGNLDAISAAPVLISEALPEWTSRTPASTPGRLAMTRRLR